jgi:MoaA/NifB/PqqE/SkfB family radical SAM enzyme
MHKWIQQLMAVGTESRLALIEKAFWNNTLRPVAMRQIEKHILTNSEAFSDTRRPQRVIQDRADMVRAMLGSAERALARHQITRTMLRNGIRALMGSNVKDLLDDELKNTMARFAEQHGGVRPPWSVVISPSKACNLHCVGCYASATEEAAEHLEWDLFDRIITDAKKQWGIRFFTISGGEPFAYRSQGKGLLDAAAKHSDSFFMVYTNGTLINKQVAARIAKLGNITPAISIEGMEAATDQRRGPGTFKRILEAMENMRQARVPFGVSLTATRLNAEELLSDEFMDFLFEEQKAIYGWMFQYMPIGEGYTLDLLPTPEQRVWMWRRVWDIIRERRILLADFWNCGTVSEGCIAAGVFGGYLYIDWNGKIMPCVFVPYAAANIRQLYAEGKTLGDVYDTPYFKGIRDWQWEYGLGKTKPEETGNWLMPCSFRDNYGMARDLICRTKPEPEDAAAARALHDEHYHQGMLAYNAALRKLFDPIWQAEYIDGKAGRTAEPNPVLRDKDWLVQITGAEKAPEPAAELSSVESD